MTRALALALVLVTAGVTAARAGGADTSAETQAKADLLFEKALAHYQANEFQAAIELFQRAYELVHDPVYLFNLGQSYRKVLDCTAAYDNYTRYLAAAPTAPNRAKVEGWLRELLPCVDQRRADHEAAERGAAAERARQAEEAKRREAMRPRTRTVDAGHGYRIGGIAVAGAGLVGVALGIAESVHATHLKSEVQAACAAGCVWADEKALDAEGSRANVLAAVSYVGGGLALLGGAGLYYLGRHRFETVQITPQPGGGIVSARLRF